MWEASESEVNSWLVDSLLQPSKKLKNGWNQKTRKTKEGWQKLRRKCSEAFRSRKTRRTQMLKLFAVILFTCETMYNKTIIRFGFCDIRLFRISQKPHPIIVYWYVPNKWIVFLCALWVAAQTQDTDLLFPSWHFFFGFRERVFSHFSEKRSYLVLAIHWFGIC